MYINVIHIHTYLGTLLEYFPSMGYETAFETEFSEPCCAETGGQHTLLVKPGWKMPGGQSRADEVERDDFPPCLITQWHSSGWDTKNHNSIWGQQEIHCFVIHRKPVDPELKCGSFSKLLSLRTEVQWVNSNYSLAK
jgi:hypothetical protein